MPAAILQQLRTGPALAEADPRGKLMNAPFVRIADFACAISLRQARTSGLGKLHRSASQRPTGSFGPIASIRWRGPRDGAAA